MKILYSHRTQGKGVEATHILGIVEAFRSMGHEVDIISPLNGDVSNKKPASASPKKKTVWSFFAKFSPEILFELFEVLSNIALYLKLKRILSGDKVDLFFERYAFSNFAGVWLSKKNKVPVILEVNYTSYTPIVRKRSYIFMPVVRLIERYLFKQANGIVVVSTYLKNHLINIGIDEKKIIVLPNAADPAIFDCEESNQDIRMALGLVGKKVIGFVGYFYPWHGIDLLIRSLPNVLKKSHEAICVLIGDGPIKQEMMELAKKEGVSSNVIFTGSVSHDILPKYISIFDIAVMPNSNEYGSPMKIFEYMAMAKPVVAPLLGPLTDAIDNGYEGYLFPPKDVNALSDCLLKLLTNNKLRIEMGRNGRKKIENIHNWKQNAISILSLYNNTLN